MASPNFPLNKQARCSLLGTESRRNFIPPCRRDVENCLEDNLGASVFCEKLTLVFFFFFKSGKMEHTFIDGIYVSFRLFPHPFNDSDFLKLRDSSSDPPPGNFLTLLIF